MRILVRLPADRWEPGDITLEDESGQPVPGFPAPCRGKADSNIATAHGNPSRDPTRPFGDHPFGTSRVTALEPGKSPPETYGPGFLLLEGVAGDALTAKQNGRLGLGAHGGAPMADGSLRATDGCLRVRNDTAEALLAHVTVGTEYVCEELTSPLKEGP